MVSPRDSPAKTALAVGLLHKMLRSAHQGSFLGTCPPEGTPLLALRSAPASLLGPESLMVLPCHTSTFTAFSTASLRTPKFQP